MGDVHVLGISGSLRRGSYNTALLRAASELLPDHAWIYSGSARGRGGLDSTSKEKVITRERAAIST
mgnify:CR=1 FL=1